jgi:hypothetical protein
MDIETIQKYYNDEDGAALQYVEERASVMIDSVETTDGVTTVVLSNKVVITIDTRRR